MNIKESGDIHILVVDDEEPIRDILESYKRSWL